MGNGTYKKTGNCQVGNCQVVESGGAVVGDRGYETDRADDLSISSTDSRRSTREWMWGWGVYNRNDRWTG